MFNWRMNQRCDFIEMKDSHKSLVHETEVEGMKDLLYYESMFMSQSSKAFVERWNFVLEFGCSWLIAALEFPCPVRPT